MELTSLSEELIYNRRYRMRKTQAMRQQLGLEPYQDASLHNDELDTPRTVSVGIEIEMTWQDVMPELARQWQDSDKRPRDFPSSSDEFKTFSADYNAQDIVLKPVLQHIIQPTIPRVGTDAYWEFSFLPTRDVEVTAAELSSLYEANILSEDHEYSLHLIVSDIPSNRDAFALMTFLELNGGTTPQRLMQAAHSKKGSWARKGIGGVRKRYGYELIGADTAYELRTLSATSFETTIQLLRTAQLCTELMNSPDDRDFRTWVDIRNRMERFLVENDLPLEAWKSPKTDIAVWQRYAALIGNSALSETV